MFTFKWNELASDAVVDSLYTAIGGVVPAPVDRTPAVLLLQTLFAHVGGVPISDTELDDSQLADLADRLLDDACRHALSRLTPADTTPGFTQADERTLPFSHRLKAHPPLPVNSANTDQLQELPKIGTRLAARVVASRHAHGPYSSLADLADRVPGIGQATVHELRNVLSFASPTELISTNASELKNRFATVVALARVSDSSDPVVSALDLLCTVCGERPHPSSVDGRRRNAVTVPVDGVPATWLSPLVGEEYHTSLFTLFDRAATSIEVCMFHIALGTADHPSSQLLDRLVAAVARGVGVRVLLDQDRPTDPYNSTVVNTRAKNFLAANGVPVKFDSEDRLLHSKFVVVDGQTVVVGNHNWAIGSFFEFDDVSLAIASSTLAQEFSNRFDLLWQSS